MSLFFLSFLLNLHNKELCQLLLNINLLRAAGLAMCANFETEFALYAHFETELAPGNWHKVAFNGHSRCSSQNYSKLFAYNIIYIQVEVLSSRFTNNFSNNYHQKTEEIVAKFVLSTSRFP